MDQEEPAGRPGERSQRRAHAGDAQPACRPQHAQTTPEGVNDQAERVSRFRAKPAVKGPMDRVIHPHLALCQTGETVPPQVVPDRQPAVAERLAEKTHQPQKKMGHVSADQHLAPDADRPEPDQQQPDHGRRSQGMPVPSLREVSPRGVDLTIASSVTVSFPDSRDIGP